MHKVRKNHIIKKYLIKYYVIFEFKFKLKQNFAKSCELKRIENEYIID